jgi:ACT domain-containing protein
MKNKRVVITVVGKDKVGIISKVSSILAENNVNILDISQTILQDLFTMIMIVDTKKLNKEFSDFVSDLENIGKDLGVKITAQKEEVFNYMHRI